MKKTTTHIVTLSFDDGFRNSVIKTAEIFEKHNLRAGFNIIATGHESTFQTPDDGYIHHKMLGDFGLWNELQQRGHDIQPHSYKHADLSAIPFEQSKDLISRCLDYFSNHLQRFDPKQSVFHFPFNRSTSALEEWIINEVRAFRKTDDIQYINPLPTKNTNKLNCISHGPENIDNVVEEKLNTFLKEKSGWFIFNTHGLDDEGWGPISSTYLDQLLNRLTKMRHVEIISEGKLLKSIDQE